MWAVLLCWGAGSGTADSGPGSPVQSTAPKIEKVGPVITLKARPFDLTQVRLLKGPFKDAMERDRSYMLGLDSDRLLHMFRVTAGLPSKAAPLAGWEAPVIELRGHTMGHYLSACALMYASTGDSAIKSKADALVAELAKCQTALKRGGYLSAFPEDFIDRVETGKKVWAPWYTLHKIYAGLVDVYVHCGNEQALQVAMGMAAWAKKRTDRLNDDQMQRMLKVEFGGMNEVLRNLYALTGEKSLLELAGRFDHRAVLDPLSEHKDQLKGLHVNTQIPKIIGAARAYELTGESYYYNVASYFWNEVTQARSYATGGTSDDEHWRAEPYQISSQLGPESHETCCTYNMLKLTRHLFSWEPDPAYADYYERALFNGILSTQNPADGMMMYYVPMVSGYYKTFMNELDSFWCCTGTGMENHAKYGDSIYFHDDDGIYVNLFIASDLSWPEKDLKLRQDTQFPEKSGTTLLVQSEKPRDFGLNIRIPSWVSGQGSVKLNGKLLEVWSSPGSYLKIRRSWKKGDRVEVDLPMDLRLERTPDDPNVAAVMYGPLVLAGKLGTAGISKQNVSGRMGPAGDPVPAPYFVVDSINPNAWLKPVAGEPLTFRSLNAGAPQDATLTPFYKVFGERYAIHWNIYTKPEWAAMAARAQVLPGGVMDALKIGDPAFEEERHFTSADVAWGAESGMRWVRTMKFLQWEMKIIPSQNVLLRCTLFQPDRNDGLDVLIDRKLVKKQPFKPAKTGGLWEVEYPIPPEWTAGKKKIVVTLKGEERKTTGRIIGCELLKR